jgi:flagellar biosynthesis protein FlhF
MHVKKFEAKSMKEALEMVKSELGPEAIILNAKDNSKKYGLVGEGSVEITAAIADSDLRKKQFTEMRLPEHKKEMLRQSPAKVQKGVINKAVNHYRTEQNRETEVVPQRSLSTTRYVDIQDEDEFTFGNTAINPASSATERIKGAAQRAWEVMQTELSKPNQQIQSHQITGVPITRGGLQVVSSVQTESINSGSVLLSNSGSTGSGTDIQSLFREINDLKMVIESFKNVPQNFVQNHPGAEYGLSYDLSFMFEKLHKAGILNEYIVEILTEVQDSLGVQQIKKRSLVEGFVARYFLNNIKIADSKKDSNVHVFVGASGHGKTSSLVKLAAHMTIRERKKVLIISTDSLKVGASDQLKIYSQILNVPFTLINKYDEWKKIEPQLKEFDMVLVDTPGFGLRLSSELMFIKNLVPPTILNPQIHLVLSATAKDQDAFEIAKRFSTLSYSDVIFTALDESTQHGLLFNFQKKFGKPLHSFGIGPNIPEDFERASRERVLDLIFQISKNPLKTV